jgi:hypothetical protein
MERPSAATEAKHLIVPCGQYCREILLDKPRIDRHQYFANGAAENGVRNCIKRRWIAIDNDQATTAIFGNARRA